MNFTPLLAGLHRNREESKKLLRQARVVLCLKDRALLGMLSVQAMESATVLAAVTAAAECRVAVEQHVPSLLVLGDQLEQGSGVALVEWIKCHQPQVHVLLLVAQEHRQHAIKRAIAAGCDGVVLQSRYGTGSWLAALHAVSGGGIYVDRSLRDAFHSCADGTGPLEALTARECEVLQRVALGESNQEIGQALFLSVDTVKTHLAPNPAQTARPGPHPRRPARSALGLDRLAR
jgi:Response regulator containing a CheY-like receiver domain and an HTH DNA-binding domain